MKIQHLQYALEIAQAGSINKAAERLMLSQPNISSALKTLEAELGFAIFSRRSNGVVPTPEGRQFLACARRMVEEYRQISAIRTGQRVRRFHLSAGYHSAIEEAFVLLCAEHPEQAPVDFSLSNANAEAIIDRVYLGKSDLGVLLLSQNSGELADLCRRKGLEVQDIRTLQYYVNLSQNHPLLKEQPFDLRRLREYPFVDYSARVLASSVELAYPDIIDPERRIFVDERDTRCRIASITNAFSIGCGLHPRIRARYDWVNIPLPGVTARMVAIHRRDTPLPPEAKRYLQLLRQEAARLE